MKFLLSLLIGTQAREFWYSDTSCQGSAVSSKTFTKDTYGGPKGWDVCEQFCSKQGADEFFLHPKRKVFLKNDEFCCQMDTIYGQSQSGRYE